MKMVKMESLEYLHRSMRELSVDMQKFRISTGAVDFDCLFSTRDTPFNLALTSRGLDPRFFQFTVEKGYRIKGYFGDMYGRLVEVLKVNGSSGQKLIPENFLIQLDAVIPRQASESNVPEPAEIIRLRTDLEEAEKPHFDTWIYWDRGSGRSPSCENMKKTLVVLGPEALEHSKRKNASSKWSKRELNRNWRSE